MRVALLPLPLLALVLPLAPATRAATPLTRADAARMALAYAPEVRAAEAKVRAAEGARRQAAALPNPTATLEAEQFGGDLPGFSRSELTFSVEQPIETGGKRSARVHERDLGVEVARAELELARRAVTAEVHRRFDRVLVAHARTSILEDAVALATDVEATVRELVRAGEVSPIEENRARGDRVLTELQRDEAANEARVARTELAATWGGTPYDAEVFVGPLDDGRALPPLDGLLARAPAAPDLVAAGRETARRAATVDAERRNRWPDVGVVVGSRRLREIRATTWIAALSVPVPLFQRNAGAIAAATADADRARHEQDALARRLELELRTAADRFSAARVQAGRLRNDLLPNARDVMNALDEGYRRGKFRLLDLLEARRNVIDTELRLNDALARVAAARADLERIVGDL